LSIRLYIPSSGAAAVTPTDWEFATQISPSTFAGVRTRISTAQTAYAQNCSTTSPHTDGALRWVFGPLAAQTITGTVEGQMRCREANAGANATLALSCKIIQPNGNDRGVLVAPVASDAAGTTWEMAVSATVHTNRIFGNASEVSDIPVTSTAVTAGDYLVVEVGFRTATTTQRIIALVYGDDSATDLTDEDTSETDARNSWIEFSFTIAFLETGTMAANLPLPTMSASGSVAGIKTGTIAANLLLPTMAASGALGHSGTIATNLPKPTMAASGALGHSGTIATSLPLPTMAATGSRVETGTIAATLPIITAAMSGTVSGGGGPTAFPVHYYQQMSM
jgi:hypothetical protein